MIWEDGLGGMVGGGDGWGGWLGGDGWGGWLGGGWLVRKVVQKKKEIAYNETQ